MKHTITDMCVAFLSANIYSQTMAQKYFLNGDINILYLINMATKELCKIAIFSNFRSYGKKRTKHHISYTLTCVHPFSIGRKIESMCWFC